MQKATYFRVRRWRAGDEQYSVKYLHTRTASPFADV